MNMNLSKLTLAVASTLFVGNVFAAAVTSANINSARTAGTLKEVWISGASAPTFNVFDAYARGCDTGTLAIFSSSTSVGKPGSIGDYSAYACTRDSGTVTVLYATAAGGSFNAYAPHVPSSMGTAPDGSAYPAHLQRVIDAGTATSCVADTWTPTTAQQTAYGQTTVPFYKSCARGFKNASSTTTEKKTSTAGVVTQTVYSALTDSAPSLPAGGFSDVESRLWDVDTSAYGTEASVHVQQAFGVAVTKELYRAMQVAQGIYTTIALANSGDAAFAADKAPNITKAQYGSIVKQDGQYRTNWSKLLGSTVDGIDTTKKNVNLVRRVATSGTQAASNAFFLNKPCSSGFPVGQENPASKANRQASFIVTEESGTSGVKTSLVAINGATPATVAVTGTSTSGTTVGTARAVVDVAQNYGIGVMSLENDNAPEYRFIKVDGVHPEAGDTNARTTMMDGSYQFVMEMVSFKANTADAYSQELIDTIALGLGNPALCTDVGRGMALSPSGDSSCAIGAQRSKGTKNGNNCATLLNWH